MENLEWEDQIRLKIEERPELLADPVWRIGNLYWCATPKASSPVSRFIPKDAQCLLLYDTFVDGWNRHCVLKARRIGFSTLIAILGADRVLFTKNTIFNMVSLDEKKAQDLLVGKIKFTYDRLPRFLLEMLPNTNGKDGVNNSSEFMFNSNWGMQSKVRCRSGTSHVLHISEWGLVANEDKKKSTEIKTGSLPTANDEEALVFLESTVQGGEQGDYWEKWSAAMGVTEETRHAKSYNAFFCPWFWDPQCRMFCPNPDLIKQSTRDYISDVQRYWKDEGWPEEDYSIDEEQMYWWQCEFEGEQGHHMNQEYPSTPQEAFRSPVDGAVYAKQMTHLEREGRITNFKHNTAMPVFAGIDYGKYDATAVWVFQVDGNRIDFIWYHEASQQPEQYFVNAVMSAGFVPIGWVLPWDCWQRMNGHLDPHCVAARYMRAGAHGLIELQRGSRRKRVECGKAMMPRCRFLKSTTEVGRMSLTSYAWPPDKPEPIHNEFSHGADSYGYIAEAESLGYFKAANRYHGMAFERTKKKQKRNNSYVLPKC